MSYVLLSKVWFIGYSGLAILIGYVGYVEYEPFEKQGYVWYVCRVPCGDPRWKSPKSRPTVSNGYIERSLFTRRSTQETTLQKGGNIIWGLRTADSQGQVRKTSQAEILLSQTLQRVVQRGFSRILLLAVLS